jgi:hypothetical protein
MAVLKSSSVTTESVLSVSRAAENLPQTTITSYFTISSADMSKPAVEIVAIVGSANTAIQALANNMKLEHSIQGDMCAVVDVNADGQFTTYAIDGVVANALLKPSIALKMASVQMLYDGDIQLTCSASATGTTSWIVYYRPLQAGATIVAV